MPDEQSSPQTPIRRAIRAEIVEESGFPDAERLLGTFYVSLDFGDDEVDDPSEDDWKDADVDEDDGDAWTGNPETWDETMIERWEAERDARDLAATAARDAAIAAHPRRRLDIDDAIAFARAQADEVVVRCDGEWWDASEQPRSATRTWPPRQLDLRPRWHFEPACGPRAEAWWVRFRVEATGLTEAFARAAAERDPGILVVRSVSSPPQNPQGRAGKPWLVQRDPHEVDVECLVVSSDDRAPSDAFPLMEALREVLPEDAARPPEPADAGDSSYWTTMGSSSRILGPATADEIAAAQAQP